MTDPLAHSPKGDVPEQSYRQHVASVRCEAERNAENAAAFYAGDVRTFVEAVSAAALYHDLGKLDPADQQVLCRETRQKLPVAHEDAGTAELLRQGRPESAALVAAHHLGLFNQSDEQAKRSRVFRQLQVADHVDRHLDAYLAVHRQSHCPVCARGTGGSLHRSGFTRRVALSCLVDADHGDTARHYGRKPAPTPVPRRWAQRLELLDRYVRGLPEGNTPRERARNALRSGVYAACRDADTAPSIRACDAPVGSGKTTAVMAHLLRVAAAKDLRHILVVLPFTNIIKQSVEVYRKALVLPGESPEAVVAEHHHQADFEETRLRQLATLWRAPIVVTTAVQFFETLAANRSARLRKLHELPGSAVFVDETHAAIPSYLWPQVWQWLETWTGEWGGHLVLASGSLPRFWELPEFVAPPRRPEEVPDLLPPSLRGDLGAAEARRAACRQRAEPLDTETLIRWVAGHPGPRLVILNTVQSAAIVAHRMRQGGGDVLHLSTALAPVHRDRIVERVRQRLGGEGRDWTLVATSCVEAGMNFSFRTGFRESCSAASLIQVSGRVNRGCEHEDAAVWDFRTLDDLLSAHPGFRVSRRVLDKLFAEGLLGGESGLAPGDLAKEAMRREVTDRDLDRATVICREERGMEYRTVAELCRVIDADTATVIVDPELAEALRRGEAVDPIRLLRHSVQMWTDRIRKLAVEPLFPGASGEVSLYVWTGPYDPEFLGYMAGVVPLLDRARRDHCVSTTDCPAPLRRFGPIANPKPARKPREVRDLDK